MLCDIVFCDCSTDARECMCVGLRPMYMYIKVTLPGLRCTYIRTYMATLYIDMNFSILLIYTVCMCYIVHICMYILYIHAYICTKI